MKRFSVLLCAGLSMAARADDDHLGAPDGDCKVGRDMLELGEPRSHAAGVDAAGRAKRGQPGVIDIMEPHRMTGRAQMGDEVEASVPRTDHRDRLLSHCSTLLYSAACISLVGFASRSKPCDAYT